VSKWGIKSFDFSDAAVAKLQMLMAGATPRRPRAKAIPHCDCDEALKAFGVKPKQGHGSRANPMVPTEERGGSCVHCDHVAPFQTPTSHRGAPRKVRGICVSTGAVVEFEHAGAARRAGFANIHIAIRNGTVRCGRRWEYV
jgi:hypothetical protein